MADTATVLFVKSTGHVLATLTRVGDPDGTLRPEDLAGDRFPVRSSSGAVAVEIEAAELDVKSVAITDDLVLQPQHCIVDDQGQVQVETATLSSVALTATGVTVTLAANVTKETPVWVQADTGTGSSRDHKVLDGKLALTTNSVTIANTFGPGTYDLLTLVPGFKPDSRSQTI
jgi:hypothetical protein